MLSAKSRRSLFVGILVFLPPVVSLAQMQPLQRSFSAGTTVRYRVRLTVRSGLEGKEAVRRADAGYVGPFSRHASDQLEWLATQHVVSVAEDGTAEIEETLQHFGGENPLADWKPDSEGEVAKNLRKAISGSLAGWSQSHALVVGYRETPTGELLGLKLEGVPKLAEAAPPLLTLWLLRALRPAASLPARPIHFDDRWQEPRAVQVNGWTDVHAWESGQWMEAAQPPEPAARLLVVQQILGRVVAGPEKPPEGSAQARFHGESLTTLSLTDGRVLAATRSATREIALTLPAGAGLTEQTEFHAQLSAEVEIQECHDSCP